MTKKDSECQSKHIVTDLTLRFYIEQKHSSLVLSNDTSSIILSKVYANRTIHHHSYPSVLKNNLNIIFL